MKTHRRAQWKAVLESELHRWSEKSSNELVAELKDLQVYEIKTDSGTFQVEVQTLENTNTYVHVGVSIDDSRLPGAMFPASSSFIRQKDFHGSLTQ